MILLRLRRSHYEMVWQILDYCKIPQKITHIIQGCNLNSKSAKNYIDLLISKNLLEIIENNYKTTQTGYKYLKQIEEIYEAIFS